MNLLGPPGRALVEVYLQVLLSPTGPVSVSGVPHEIRPAPGLDTDRPAPGLP